MKTEGAMDFFKKVINDAAICTGCNVLIYDWEEGDDVLTEHLRHSSCKPGNVVCPFLIKIEA